MTEPVPETPPPERRGWVHARRAGLALTGLTVAVFGIAGAAVVSPLLVLGGIAGLTAAGAGVWHLPRIRRHFAHPSGHRPQRAGRSRTRRVPSARRPAGSRGPGRKPSFGGGRGKGGMPRIGGGRKSSGGLGKSLGRKGTGGTGRKAGSGMGRKGSGGSLLKRGKAGGTGTGRRSTGKALGGAAGRRKTGTGATGRRRTGGMPRVGPSGRRTGTGGRRTGPQGRGSRRRPGTAGRATGRRQGAQGRGPRARAGTGRTSRWRPWQRRNTGPQGRRPTGRQRTRRQGAGNQRRPGQQPRANRWARRGPHRFARFMNRRRGTARQQPRPRTFGGPAPARVRTWRHPFRGTYAARKPAGPKPGKTRKTAFRARASRWSMFRWAAGRHPLYVVPAMTGRARRAGRWTRHRATGWWNKRRARWTVRRARQAAARQPMTVRSVRLGPPKAPPPPPRPSGPRPRARRVDPVSSGPAGARAAAAARAREAGTVLEAANEAVTQHLGGWMPNEAEDILGFCDHELPNFCVNLADALGMLAERVTAEMPLDPAVGEHIREMASGAHAMAQVAREAAGTVRNKHEAEIRRVEEPNVNENLWNVH